MKNNNLVAVLVIIVVAAAGFFGGMKYQQTKRSVSTNVFSPRQFGNTQNRNGGGTNLTPNGTPQNGRTGIRPVMGEITDVSDKSITVKTVDGGSKIVFVSTKTEINKAAVATFSDLSKGQTVSIFGQENTDGSVTAQNIQLNPLQRNATPSAVPNK
ncbi:MAG: hypothetical protein UV68_C0005G0012 [Candidatus Collierbacteria bacterium GW2011_GWC2_43_12]|uniref:DUF5666 domain-containing protein n=1 Tax=Candidatus Collierbacteria bacterium GW2011_GWC2_43_12 TaxID=1618390 RepID=A0A0G1D9W4_9BACT|nr:MAG: hypothetical protein UV68_C0005G0012 [Candidatus Collierbacteria bacterium GW2011_GWC2_43_12]